MHLLSTHTAVRGNNICAMVLSDLFVKDILNMSAGKDAKIMVSSFYFIMLPMLTFL